MEAVYNEICDDRWDLNKRQWSKKRGMFQQLKNKRSEIKYETG